MTDTVTSYVWPAVYIGDDWAFPYTYANPDETPINLTGASPKAQLFAKNQLAPVFVMSGAPGVTIVDAVAGKVVFSVTKELTATLAADGCSKSYPTRIQVQLQDSLGKLRTFRVDAVPVVNARFELTTTSSDEIGTSVFGNGPQGAAGPAGTGINPLTFQITAASTFTASHGFTYPPAHRLLDPSGAEVETDVVQSSGQVVLTFPAPFTGTLVLT